MSSPLSTIQPQIDAMLKLFTTLPTVAIDTTTSVSQFVQNLLSTGFFAAALTSDGKSQVVAAIPVKKIFAMK